MSKVWTAENPDGSPTFSTQNSKPPGGYTLIEGLTGAPQGNDRIQYGSQEYQDNHVATQYKRDRRNGTAEKPIKYAPEGDQLDEIYQWLDGFLTSQQKLDCPFYQSNWKVKDAHKKPV